MRYQVLQKRNTHIITSPLLVKMTYLYILKFIVGYQETICVFVFFFQYRSVLFHSLSRFCVKTHNNLGN